MRNKIVRVSAMGTLLLGMGLMGAGPGISFAAAQATTDKPLPPVSLDLRDAPIRQALEQLFASSGVQFSIDNNVAGFVTLKIVDQPFDNALRVLLRSSSSPLSYTREGGVYFIKPRVISLDTNVSTAPTPPESLATDDSAKKFASLEMIQLTYADPADLQGILGVAILKNFSRSPSLTSGSGLGSGSLGGNRGSSGSSGSSLGSGGLGGYGSGLGSGSVGSSLSGGSSGSSLGRL